MDHMSIETAFLWICAIIGVGSVSLTLFALNIRRKHEHEHSPIIVNE